MNYRWIEEYVQKSFLFMPYSCKFNKET